MKQDAPVLKVGPDSVPLRPSTSTTPDLVGCAPYVRSRSRLIWRGPKKGRDRRPFHRSLALERILARRISWCRQMPKVVDYLSMSLDPNREGSPWLPIFEECSSDAQRYARRLLGGRGRPDVEAKDIVQETQLALLRRKPNGLPEGFAAARGYYMTTLQRTAMNMLRPTRTNVKIVSIENAENVAASKFDGHDTEFVTALVQCLNRLPERQLQAILRGSTGEDIAEALGWPAPAENTGADKKGKNRENANRCRALGSLRIAMMTEGYLP